VSEDLKPCPFCGGEAEMLIHNIAGYCVDCKNPECGSDQWTELKAIEKWNSRV